MPNNWTAEDTYRQLGLTALLAADLGQTMQDSAASAPNVYQGGGVYTAGMVHHELNPLLGPHPSRNTSEAYFAGVALLAWGVAYALPEKYRKPFQSVLIGIEANQVRTNLMLGVRIGF